MNRLQSPCWLIVSAITVIAALGSPAVVSQTTAAGGSVVVVPVVAQTSSYSTEVYVRNPNATVLTLDVKFYEAVTSSVPGQRTCSQFVAAANTATILTLGTQCTLGAGNHHGLLILEDAAAQKVNVFTVYSRSQTPQGNGFSVEGFPVGNFSGAGAGVVGLRRTKSGANYQSNCFVAALGEAVDYQIDLRNGADNTLLGNAITGSLAPYQMRRHLDVFTAAGLANADYTNVRAVFDNTNAGNPAFVAFCTVQESITFGADFRIAKSTDALDNRQRRAICYGQDACGTVTTTDPAQITDVTKKVIHQTMIAHPDYVKCELVSGRIGDLEIQLRGPGDTFLSPVFPSSPPFDSGGNNKTSFYVFTGHRNDSTLNTGGYATRWFIDVSYREGSANSTVPIPYGITCQAGNGITVPWTRAIDTDDF